MRHLQSSLQWSDAQLQNRYVDRSEHRNSSIDTTTIRGAKKTKQSGPAEYSTNGAHHQDIVYRYASHTHTP